MYVCILALRIRHAKRMLRIILSFVASLVLPYFYILSHKGDDLWGKNTEQKKYVLILQINFF